MYSEGDAEMPSRFSVKVNVSGWIMNDTVRLQLCRYFVVKTFNISHTFNMANAKQYNVASSVIIVYEEKNSAPY